MEDYRIATISRNTYLPGKNDKWKATDQEVSFDIWYAGNDARHATVRFLQQNDLRTITELLGQVAWLENGFFRARSKFRVTTPFGEQTFNYIYRRRDDSGRPLVGDGYEPVYETRKKVFYQMSKMLREWMESITS